MLKTSKLIIPIILAAAVILIAPIAIHSAEAHLLKTFNTVSVKIGWANEPPLVGDTNQIDAFVYNGTDDTAPPITNTGLDNMKITVQYGGQSKLLSFDPSDDTPGLYIATMTPTQLGTYNVIIQGTIGGVTIPTTTYPMQEVESKDKYNFPPVTGGMINSSANMTTSTTPVGAQVSQNIINQLESDINDAKNSANNAVQSYGRVAQSFQDVKNATDSLYMMSFAGIGVGIAGVVIAVIALTRKT